MNFQSEFVAVSKDTLEILSVPHTSGDNDWIMEHLIDSRYIHLEPFISTPIKLPEFPPLQIGGITIDLSITKNILMMMVASLILIVILIIAGRQNKRNKVPRGLGNLVEMIMVFLRDEVIRPNIGEAGIRFLDFFFTLFLFILTANLLGLFPYMATPTGNISVTAALALITFILIQVYGIKNNGLRGYIKGLVPSGVPVWILPIMVIVEFLGMLTKPFALCIRLFANMTAGHVVIFALISLIFTLGYVATPVSLIFALFIYVLEILISLLQAYIFTMLSSLFIGMAIHQEH